MDRTTRAVAGIRLPDSDVASAAELLSREASDRVLYAHAVRSYLFAALLARDDGLRVDDEALYVGCVLHDIGLVPGYEDPVKSFEHVSADVAVDLTSWFGWQPERRSNLHRAIVLHMAAEVSESESPETRALEAGVALDVTGSRLADIDERTCVEIFRHFPRGAFKRDFARLMHREAERKPHSAAAALTNRGLLDRIRKAPFEDTE
ncbi:MAG TPA: HD domain-containing protein [Gaiellaceae bacterium]|nr:HD domain-containing protein [Gaiellaceae bacterium]